MAPYAGLGAMLGSRSMLAGRGAGMIARSEFDEQMRQARLGETSALATALNRQQNLDRQFTEGVRQFDVGQQFREKQFSEDQLRFDVGHQFKERQFGEGIRRFDEGVRQFETQEGRLQQGLQLSKARLADQIQSAAFDRQYKKEAFKRSGEQFNARQGLAVAEFNALQTHRENEIRAKLAAAQSKGQMLSAGERKVQREAWNQAFLGQLKEGMMGDPNSGGFTPSAIESYFMAVEQSGGDPSVEADRARQILNMSSRQTGDKKAIAFADAATTMASDMLSHIKAIDEHTSGLSFIDRILTIAPDARPEAFGAVGMKTSAKILDDKAKEYLKTRGEMQSSLSLWREAAEITGSKYFKERYNLLNAKMKKADSIFAQVPRFRAVVELENVARERDELMRGRR